MTRFITRLALGIMVSLAAVSATRATNDVWDGNGAVPPTGIWGTGTNWSGDNSTPGNSDTATFNLAQTYAVNFAADPLAIQNLTVSGGTVTFQNSGGVQTLDVTSGGALDVFIGTATLNLGTASNTLPVNLMVGDDLILNSGGILNINAGSIAMVPTTGTLTINSGGRVNIGSGLTTSTLIANGDVNVNGGVLDHNAGAFTLAAGKNLIAQNNGNVSFTGAYTVNGGSIYTVGGGADFSTTASLNIGSTTNGTMTVDGADSTLAMGNLNVMTNGVGPGLVGTLTLSNSAVATQNGTSLGIGQTAFANTANLNVQSGAVLNSSATTFTVQSSGKLSVTGGGIVTADGDLAVNSAGGTGGAIPGAEININGGASAFSQSGATTITVGHVATGTGAINVGTTTAGGTLTTGTGLFTINKTGTVTIGSGTNTGTLNANGNVTIDGGLVTRGSGGTLALESGKTMTIQNAGRASFVGDYSIAANSIYNISGTSSMLETLSGGALSLNNGAQVNVSAGGLVAAAGNMTIGNGTSGTLSIQGINSAAAIGGASSLTVGHATTGMATINIGTTTFGGTLTTGAGPFTINSTGTVNVGAIGRAGTLNAEGNVTIDGGVLQISRYDSTFALSAGKTMTIQNGGRASFASGYVAKPSCIYNIIGANSKLEADGLTFDGGAFNDIQVNVSSGGSISSVGSLNVDGFASGTLLVDGSGSSATVTNNIGTSHWGRYGTANVTFSNNAVGTFADNIEMANVFLGEGTANVNILSGADLSVGRKLLLAANGGTTTSATLNVNGAGSTITLSSSDLVVGHESTGTAAINIGTTNDGGTLVTGTGHVNIKKTGTVTVGSGTNTGALNDMGGLFRITGGLLQVGTGSNVGVLVMLLHDAGTLKGSGNVSGQVINSSGLVSPGTPAGTLSINGPYTQAAGGQLLIELASASAFDKITTTGAISLAGTLDVDLLGGFIPQSGSVFPIISSAGGVSGTFDTVLLPTLAGANWQLRYEPNSVSLQFTLVGDYNLNGTVDAADYVVWRKSLSTSVSPPFTGADGDGDGIVDADDHGVWRAHFGNSVPGAGSGAGGASPSQAAVPEPGTTVLLMFAAAGWCLLRGRAA